MLEKSFDPKTAEARLYEMWEQSGAFKPSMDTAKEAYSIVIPPPNVTGSLHMGHALNNTLQDILCRFERMRGKDVLWQPGMDHAGIATQMVVERKLAAQGIARKDMSREDFVAKIWEWKEQSGGNIKGQLKRLGASCDWSRERFTLDEDMSAAVTKVFVEMYNKGLIYRDKRLVNWDPHFQTAISDLEVETKAVNGHYWHLRYPLADGVSYEHPIMDEEGNAAGHETRDYVVVATSRPETMLGDMAVAVHPDDERYASLVGKFVDLPIVGRRIPIVADDYADMEKGSGAVKITPAHDFNDFDVGKRAGIATGDMINILTDTAHIIDSDHIPTEYHGLSTKAARKAIVTQFETLGLLQEIEDLQIEQPFGDRSGVIIEPFLTDQWYVDAKTLSEPAIEVVNRGHASLSAHPREGGELDAGENGIPASAGMSGAKENATRFIPENWKKTYDHWMGDIQPWCISRQLWWGHRVPAWFDENGKIYVAGTQDEAQAQAGAGATLTQDSDVLDTWFSSALWPFSTMGWPETTPELEKFYPTSVLITGFDIIFFWVARMIMQGMEFMDEVPFRDVYIHALVRDEDGSKMSKSEGNVIDPVDLIQGIDIDALVAKRTTGLRQPQKAPKVEKATRKQYPDGFDAYGADALRFTLAIMAAMGRDIKLSVSRVEGYRNFGTKIWNAALFAQHYGIKSNPDFDPTSCKLAVNKWIVTGAVQCAANVTRSLESYRFNEASDAIYKFAWGSYCDWYLELIKPVLMGDDAAAKAETEGACAWAFDQILKLLYPFMPFITEELWHKTADSRENMLIISDWPKQSAELIDDGATDDINWLVRLISAIRSVRSEMNIPPSKKGPLVLIGASAQTQKRMSVYADAIERMARVDSFSTADSAPKGALQTVVDEAVCALPLEGLVDFAAERARLEKEIAKTQAEIDRVDKKLGNASFVDRAPEAVVAQEHERRASFTSELEKLMAALADLPD